VEVREIIWLDVFVEKLWRKHHVCIEEAKRFSQGDHVSGGLRVKTWLGKMYTP